MRAKRVISMMIMFVLLLTASTISSGAVTAPYLSGDVNYDDSVDVVDATLIQRHLAEMFELDYEQSIVADFDHDGEVSIIDVTWIQRSDLKIKIPEACGGWIPTDVVINEFYADYDSGKAPVNSPIEFTAAAYASSEGVTYEFYLDGAMVQPRSENPSLVYVFENSGEYNVTVRAYNDWGIYNEYSIPCYRVVDGYPYEDPSLITARIEGEGSGSATVTAQATGGTAPYTYRFTILGFDWYELTGLSDEAVNAYESYIKYHGESRWQLGEIDGMTCLYCDFTESNRIDIDMSMLPVSYYYVQVQAKDAAGNLTPIEQLEYRNDLSA